MFNRGGGRGGNAKADRAQNFSLAMKRLFKEALIYKNLVIIAVILASISSIISIVTPKRLARLTDEISYALTVDQESVKELSTLIVEGKAQNDITYKDSKISKAEQLEFLEMIKKLEKVSDKDELKNVYINMPDSIKAAIETKINLDLIKNLVLILFALYLLSSIFSYIQNRIIISVSNDFAKSLREKISLKINKLPLNFYDKQSQGDILSRVTNDVDTVVSAIGQATTNLISSTVLIIGALIMMYYTNAAMATTAVLSSLIGFYLTFSIMKSSQKYFIQKQAQLGDLNGHIEEVYSNLLIVKTYNGEQDAIKTFKKHNDNLYISNFKSRFFSSLMRPIMLFIGNLGYVAVVVLGAALAINGKISFGIIIAFIMYIRSFSHPLSDIAQSLTEMQSIAAASERVFEFLDEEEEKEETAKTKLAKNKIKGNVEFKNLNFAYPGKRKKAISQFNAKAKAGQKIAIVGPTGAGKTTLVNLLMRFYEFTSGDITIDGVSIKDLSKENLRDLFTMVLQDTWLFEGTVMDNIAYNSTGVSEEDLKRVCKSIGLDHFIKTLPKAYDTILNEAESVSSGQKQLITIARGIVKDSPLLILDEATSSVDARTEELVQKAMDKLSEGKTSFIIAHRLSTIKNANLILVMKDGNIIEQGTHDELMNEEGFYFDLYNSQFVL